MKKKNASKTTLIVDEPQWVIRTDKASPIKFYVAIGNKFLASEVLPIGTPESVVDSYRAKGYQMLQVPSGYWEAFNDNVELALTDIAGISTVGALKYISGVRLNETKVDTYENPFTKEIIEVGTNDNIQYSQFFNLSKVPVNCKSKPLYIHLDMSKSGDKTGIAGTWIMGKKPGDPASSSYYRLAFGVAIKAPKGYEVSFDKNRIFINWLKSQGFNIKGISADTFQSAQIQQQLRQDGFEVKTLSVDRLDSVPGTNQKVCLPYAFFKTTIYEKRVEVFQKCDLLTDEIIGLEKEPDGHINHPENGTQGSKDLADAFCGSLFSASQDLDEFVYNYGEDVEDMINVSSSTDTSHTRQQIQVDFEEELAKITMPDSIKKQQERDKDAFMDFGNGPAQTPSGPLIGDGMIIW